MVKRAVRDLKANPVQKGFMVNEAKGANGTKTEPSSLLPCHCEPVAWHELSSFTGRTPAPLSFTQQRLNPLHEAPDCWAVEVELVVLHELMVEVGVEFLSHSEC